MLEDGILKVGGRLHNAPVSESRKHPMILPANHVFTEMVATYYHQKLLHAGPQLLIASLREQFWPLRVRNLARKVMQGCLKCYRCKPTVQEQLMGDLPSERVTPTYPFLKTGVDLCGPLYYRHGGRKSSPVKCYVAIFVCLVTKAVHIELVANLTTDSFVSALKRFVARRSKPAIIECDNAKNFVGASRTLAELLAQFKSQQHQQAVVSYCAEEGIEFKFIPHRSSNFGGLWEAAVKSFKKHLKSTIGTTVLQKDDLETLIIQIESCLNSRPLTQLSTDPEYLEVLTPGHFLVHRPLLAAAEPSLESVPQNRLDRYQQTQEFVRRIWKRWSTDYLSGLQPRTKWTRQRDNLAVGTLVLLKEEKLPPLKWCLGRVVRLFHGEDGNVRVVSVKTKDGEFNRAISKVCVLPIRQPSADGPQLGSTLCVVPLIPKCKINASSRSMMSTEQIRQHWTLASLRFISGVCEPSRTAIEAFHRNDRYNRDGNTYMRSNSPQTSRANRSESDTYTTNGTTMYNNILPKVSCSGFTLSFTGSYINSSLRGTISIIQPSKTHEVLHATTMKEV